MPSHAPPVTSATEQLRPRTLLWLLAGFGLATMNAPADIAATLFHLRVPDPDDAMRMVEVRDLVDGQGWYDLIQHRFGPPAGILSHWSRLVDAPIAGLVWLVTPLTGRALAEGIAAAFWPMLLFCLYGFVLYRGSRRAFGRRAAILALIVATQTIGVTVQFAAGRVDHHGLQLTIILGLALAVMARGWRAGFVGGGLAAASLAVGLEGLPFVAAGALFLAGDWILRGDSASETWAGFGLGLGLSTPLLLASQTSPVLWGATACDALSPPWLYLAEGGFVLTLICAAFAPVLPRRGARLAVTAGLGMVLMAGFAVLFPVCVAGPFAGLTTLVREHWLLKVNEMTSVSTFIARGQWEALAFYPPLIIATFVASWRAPRSRAWATMAVFLWPGLVLGLVEFRGLYVANGLVPLVAGVFIDRALTQGATRWNWGVAVTAAGLISTVWIAPATLGETLLPASRTAPDPQGATACLSDDALLGLAALPAGTVLAPVFMGPAILLHTPHTIVAAPYHRAVPEIAASLEGLGGSERDLRQAMATYRASYLVTCSERPADDLQAEPAFATRLTRGTATAAWLDAVPTHGALKIWKANP